MRIVGYACAWLVWVCSWMGRLDDAIIYGERAQEITKLMPSDHYLHFKSLGGLAHAHCYKGDTKKALEAGEALVEYGQRYSNNRSLFMGQVEMGNSHFVAGDLPSAIECVQSATAVSVDPIYFMGGRLLLAMNYIAADRLQEAEVHVHEIIDFSEEFGCEVWGTPALLVLGVITIAKGRMGEGLKMIEDARQSFLKSGNRWYLARCEMTLGKVYLQVVEGGRPINFL